MSRVTETLAGKTVTQVLKNDHVLVIQCDDMTEVRIVWTDDSGKALSGTPKVVFAGKNIQAQPQLIRLPCGLSFAEVLKDMRRGAERRAAGKARGNG